MKRVRRVNLKELFVASLVVTSEDCFGGNCQFVEIARKLQHTKNFSIRKFVNSGIFNFERTKNVGSS